MLFSIVSLYSQTDSTEYKSKSNISINVDFMNRYIWRAIDFGNTPCIQPSITYSYKNFNIGTWASTNTMGDFTEIDLLASYSIGNFNIQLTDFFFPFDSLTNNNSFFNFDNNNTGHTIEAGIKYENQKIPIYLAIYSFIYGYDPKPFSTKKYYSTYIEMGYSFAVKDIECELVAGITPFESYYANKFSLVNLGFTVKKNIPITSNFSLPIKASFITNPRNENAYLTFGISL